MKHIPVLLSALITVFCATTVFASGTRICVNGDFEAMGDSYYEIHFYEDGIQFLPYESAFDFDLKDIEHVGNTYFIVNKKTTFSAEGEDYPERVVNAKLTFNSEKTELSAEIQVDDEAVQNLKMTCSKE
ncbi:MAG: hypothetical protein K2Q26_06565 [Bdellovibrionales bacterium]|nr:hypothetical protein [Bdellovibrionales bacterium]